MRSGSMGDRVCIVSVPEILIRSTRSNSVTVPLSAIASARSSSSACDRGTLKNTSIRIADAPRRERLRITAACTCRGGGHTPVSRPNRWADAGSICCAEVLSIVTTTTSLGGSTGPLTANNQRSPRFSSSRTPATVGRNMAPVAPRVAPRMTAFQNLGMVTSLQRPAADLRGPDSCESGACPVCDDDC